MHKKIALAGPYITKKEEDYVLDAVKNGWYETYDMHIRRLEKKFAELVGSRFAIATFCGTHALHLAVIALGLKPGDEVICADQSYIATAQAISYVGAVPVFVDIKPDTLCLDPKKIEEAITDRTKAIMVVHLAGFASDMDRIVEIARANNLRIIEDACQAVGVKYKGKYCGTIGDIGAYSFQGSKIAVGGEGGMLVTDNEDFYNKARHYGTFCRNDSIDYLWSDDIGYNYRISNVTAALILAQIERIDELIQRKREIFEWYRKYLKPISKIRMLFHPDDTESNYAYVVGYLDEKDTIERDLLISKMIENNIYLRPGYPSMSLMLNYERRFSVSNSEHYHRHGLVFPTAMNLEEDDIKYVCEMMNKLL